MNCPTLEQLEQFADPNATAPGGVGAHVVECTACQSRLEELREHARLAQRVVVAAHAATTAPVGSSRASRAAPPDLDLPGYQILEEISRGGQGIVFLALQRSTGRRVALKVLRAGPLADAGERARFEREVQVLAQLQHPHIVTIHDSGAVGGNAYYVMDYVPGESLDAHIAARRAAAGGAADAGASSSVALRSSAAGGRASMRRFTRDTLGLFRQVCDAVHAAHVHGIIHRDLKPSNIRVGEDGQPRVLDFGLAKRLAASPENGDTAMTASGQFLGSLPWSSPEQAEGATDRIDTRSDVYALGVTLYQCLTGRFPYDVDGPLRVVLDRISQAEPIRPRRVARYIDDELETLLLKALAKAPGRRYQSAGELAREIDRYLAGERLIAKRDTLWYALRSLVRRHRVLSAVSGAFALFGVGAFVTVLTLYFMVEAARQRAVTQARRADQVAQFSHDMITGIDPEVARELDTTLLRQLVRDAARDLEHAPPTVPEVAAAMHHAVGDAFLAIGQTADAERHIAQALALLEADEEAAPLRMRVTDSLAEVQFANQEWSAAEQSLREILKLAAARADIAPEFVLQVKHNLAGVLSATRRFDEAETLYREVLSERTRTLGNRHKDTLDTLSELSLTLIRRKKLDEAERLLREARPVARAALGATHPRYLHMLGIYANIPYRRGDLAALAEIKTELVEGCERIYPANHKIILAHRTDRAVARFQLGRVGEAVAELREVVPLRRQVQGASRWGTLIACCSLAEMLIAAGEFDQADALLQDTLARAVAQQQNPEMKAQMERQARCARGLLAELHLRRGELEAAEAAAAEIDAEISGADHRRELDDHVHRDRLGRIRLTAGRPAEAEAALRAAVGDAQAVLAPEHWQIAICRRDLGICLAALGRTDEASAELNAAFPILVARLGREHAETLSAAGALAELGAGAEAAPPRGDER